MASSDYLIERLEEQWERRDRKVAKRANGKARRHNREEEVGQRVPVEERQYQSSQG